MKETEPVPAIVRAAETLESRVHAAFKAEDGAGLTHSERGRDTGKVLKEAWEVYAPRKRWNAWLKEQGVEPRRAQERIQLCDNWSSIPANIAGKGLRACFDFLAELLRKPRGSSDDDDETEAVFGDWKIIHGDCRAHLGIHLADAPRLIFADPPYNIGIDYGDGEKADRLPDADYLQFCDEWMAVCHARLTEDGSLWVLIGDEYAAEYGVRLKAVGFVVRRWIKWYETFGVNCQGNFNRTSRHLFYCVKDAKRFVFNEDAVIRPSDRQLKWDDKRAKPEGKLWDDVWGVAWGPNDEGLIPRLVGNAEERIAGFPTQLPLKLLRPIVRCASKPGDLVMDVFSGSGTTGVAALEGGRRFVGIEKSLKFVEASRKRLRHAERELFPGGR